MSWSPSCSQDGRRAGRHGFPGEPGTADGNGVGDVVCGQHGRLGSRGEQGSALFGNRKRIGSVDDRDGTVHGSRGEQGIVDGRAGPRQEWKTSHGQWMSWEGWDGHCKRRRTEDGTDWSLSLSSWHLRTEPIGPSPDVHRCLEPEKITVNSADARRHEAVEVLAHFVRTELPVPWRRRQPWGWYAERHKQNREIQNNMRQRRGRGPPPMPPPPPLPKPPPAPPPPPWRW